MRSRRTHPAAFLVAALGAVLGVLALAPPARAIPAFAGQTGQPCAACHVGSFGPQLTPFGIAFKLGGYTMQGGEGVASEIPLSAMVISSFTNTASAQPSSPAQHFATNDNFSLDTVSLFLGGHLTDYAGGLIQGTWLGTTQAMHLDNSDLRLTAPAIIGDGVLQVGVDLNNNPTVQDPYNTTFAWGFPYVASSLAPVPTAQPVLVSSFATNSIGVSAYAWWNQSIYAEAGLYRTMTPGWVAGLGETGPPGFTDSVAPYARLAYQQQWSGQLAEIGALGFYAPLSEAAVGMPGQNSYIDYGIDAMYQFLGSGEHVVSVYGIFLRENQDLAASYAAGAADGSAHTLNEFRGNVSYYYDQSYGVTLGFLDVFGTSDPLLYAPAAVTGSANGSPNSKALTAQIDWTPFGKVGSWGSPFANLRLGVQYVDYLEFNGGTTNYDGFGRNASDNNTLYLFAWLAF